MRTFTFVLGLSLVVAFLAPAQEAVAPVDSVGPWTHRLVAGLTATQVSFTNWSQGGENAFSWTTTIDGQHVYDKGMISWGNTYKFAYGQAKLASLGIRKTDDKIDFESIATYKMGTYVNPYFAATLKTQFTRGYDYAAAGIPAVSDMFDPAYLTQAVGLGYQPIPEVKTRLGAALREVLTKIYTHYADDPATPEVEKTRIEGGLESVTTVEWKVEENVLFTSKLELFAAFKSLDEVVVRNDNTLAAKVSQYLVVNLNVQVLHDRVVTPRTQLKQTIAFGLSYVLI